MTAFFLQHARCNVHGTRLTRRCLALACVIRSAYRPLHIASPETHQSELTNAYEYAPLPLSAIIPKKRLRLPKTAIGAASAAVQSPFTERASLFVHAPRSELVPLASPIPPAVFSNIDEKSGRPCLKSASYSEKMRKARKPHSTARRSVIVCIFSRTSLCTSFSYARGRGAREGGTSPFACGICTGEPSLHKAAFDSRISEIVSYTDRIVKGFNDEAPAASSSRKLPTESRRKPARCAALLQYEPISRARLLIYVPFETEKRTRTAFTKSSFSNKNSSASALYTLTGREGMSAFRPLRAMELARSPFMCSAEKSGGVCSISPV